MTTANTNCDSAKILKDLLNLGIQPELHQQYLCTKKMVTQKILSLLNTQVAKQKRIYKGLRQENIRLHN